MSLAAVYLPASSGSSTEPGSLSPCSGLWSCGQSRSGDWGLQTPYRHLHRGLITRYEVLLPTEVAGNLSGSEGPHTPISLLQASRRNTCLLGPDSTCPAFSQVLLVDMATSAMVSAKTGAGRITQCRWFLRTHSQSARDPHTHSPEFQLVPTRQ